MYAFFFFVASVSNLTFAARNQTAIDECYRKHANLTLELSNETYCNATFDGFSCWAPTRVGDSATHNCPKITYSDRNRILHRECGLEGLWLNGDNNSHNMTDYTLCFPKVMQTLMNRVYGADFEAKLKIARITRFIETIGFGFSCVSLTTAIGILMTHSSLDNSRTQINKSLFKAMNAQVVLRLTIYLDQAFFKNYIVDDEEKSGLESIPYLCEFTYIVLEHLITVMFTWMLAEGISLNNIVTNRVLRGDYPYKMYWLIGWGVPIPITASWTAVILFMQKSELGCLYGYNFDLYYWLVQGPRLLIVLVNVGFLCNILRVLVMKLKTDTSSDIVKVRKAVKAAMLLLPLLGITNGFSMWEGPVEGPVWLFAVWSITTHTLRSLQGAFLAWLYCLGTTEVHTAVAQSFSIRRSIFRYRHPRLAQYLCPLKRSVERINRLNELRDMGVVVMGLDPATPNPRSSAVARGAGAGDGVAGTGALRSGRIGRRSCEIPRSITCRLKARPYFSENELSQLRPAVAARSSSNDVPRNILLYPAQPDIRPPFSEAELNQTTAESSSSDVARNILLSPAQPELRPPFSETELKQTTAETSIVMPRTPWYRGKPRKRHHFWETDFDEITAERNAIFNRRESHPTEKTGTSEPTVFETLVQIHPRRESYPSTSTSNMSVSEINYARRVIGSRPVPLWDEIVVEDCEETEVAETFQNTDKVDVEAQHNVRFSHLNTVHEYPSFNTETFVTQRRPRRARGCPGTPRFQRIQRDQEVQTLNEVEEEE